MRYPALAILIEAVCELRKHRKHLVTRTLVPAVALVSLELAREWMPDTWHFGTITLVLSVPFYALFAIACHRAILCGPGTSNSNRARVWTTRETRFVWRLFQLGIVWAGATVITNGLLMVARKVSPFQIPTEVEAVIVLLLCLYVVARFGLVLPAQAIDRPIRFRESWERTRVYGLQILAACLAPTAAIIVLAYIEGRALGPTDSLLLDLAWTGIGLVALAIEVSVVSVAYRGLVLRHEDTNTVQARGPGGAGVN